MTPVKEVAFPLAFLSHDELEFSLPTQDSCILSHTYQSLSFTHVHFIENELGSVDLRLCVRNEIQRRIPFPGKVYGKSSHVDARRQKSFRTRRRNKGQEERSSGLHGLRGPITTRDGGLGREN